MIKYKLVERNEGQMPRNLEYLAEVERKFNENVQRQLSLDPSYVAPDISQAFTWSQTPEGGEYWAMADRLFYLEYIDEEMPVELKECPFCGNVAKMFPPDKDGNIISCKLGHAPMRTVEGWNTREGK